MEFGSGGAPLIENPDFEIKTPVALNSQDGALD